MLQAARERARDSSVRRQGRLRWYAPRHSFLLPPCIYILSPPNCSDEPSNYLDSRHDTSVADSSSSLGCGSEQLPPPCLLPLLPLHLPTPHRTLPWRGDDDSNCMYYTTTCNTMGHGSIGLTLSAAPPAVRPPRTTLPPRPCPRDPLRPVPASRPGDPAPPRARFR